MHEERAHMGKDKWGDIKKGVQILERMREKKKEQETQASSDA